MSKSTSNALNFGFRICKCFDRKILEIREKIEFSSIQNSKQILVLHTRAKASDFK